MVKISSKIKHCLHVKTISRKCQVKRSCLKDINFSVCLENCLNLGENCKLHIEPLMYGMLQHLLGTPHPIIL